MDTTTGPTVFEHSYGATVLKAEHVNKTLGGTFILRDVNLEIKDVRRPLKP